MTKAEYMRGYMKRYRKTNKYRAYNQRIQEQWRSDNRAKVKAQWTVRNAVRDGRMTLANSCERCGKNDKITTHHYDYKKPMDVEWICTFCHAQENMAARYE